jgi:CHASE3 domain sensor protein
VDIALNARSIAPPLTVGIGLRMTIAFAVLVRSAMASFLLVREIDAANRWVIHTLEVRSALLEFSSELRASQVGLRSYLIGGEDAVLPATREALARARRQLEALTALTADHPAHQAHMPELSERYALG